VPQGIVAISFPRALSGNGKRECVREGPETHLADGAGNPLRLATDGRNRVLRSSAVNIDTKTLADLAKQNKVPMALADHWARLYGHHPVDSARMFAAISQAFWLVLWSIVVISGLLLFAAAAFSFLPASGAKEVVAAEEMTEGAIALFVGVMMGALFATMGAISIHTGVQLRLRNDAKGFCQFLEWFASHDGTGQTPGLGPLTLPTLKMFGEQVLVRKAREVLRLEKAKDAEDAEAKKKDGSPCINTVTLAAIVSSKESFERAYNHLRTAGLVSGPHGPFFDEAGRRLLLAEAKERAAAAAKAARSAFATDPFVPLS